MLIVWGGSFAYIGGEGVHVASNIQGASMAGKTIAVRCLMIGIAFGAQTALAATVHVGGISIHTNALGGTPSPPTSAVFQAPKFSTSLGTLQGVTLEFRLSYTGEIRMLNSTSQEQAVVSASSSIPVLIDYPGGQAEFTVNASFDTIIPLLAFKISPFTVGYNFIGAGGTMLLPPVNLPPNDISSYIGPGKVDFMLHYGSGFASGSNPSVDYFANASSWAGVNVTYEFEPVPEPSSLALAIVAAGGTAIIGRRKRFSRGHAAASSWWTHWPQRVDFQR